MKKMLFTVSLLAIMAGCSKEGEKEGSEKENHCPVVSASTVPASVLSAFQTLYPKEMVISWFRKDSIGYCAYFIKPVNQKKLAEFTNSGTFVSEMTDNNYDGNFEDSTGLSSVKGATVCECTVPE